MVEYLPLSRSRRILRVGQPIRFEYAYSAMTDHGQSEVEYERCSRELQTKKGFRAFENTQRGKSRRNSKRLNRFERVICKQSCVLLRSSTHSVTTLLGEWTLCALFHGVEYVNIYSITTLESLINVWSQIAKQSQKDNMPK